MEQNDFRPKSGPEIRLASPESRAVYKDYQDLIKAGGCRVEDLRLLYKNEKIDLEQFAKLSAFLAEELEKRDGIDPLTGVLDHSFFKSKIDGLIEKLNNPSPENKNKMSSVMVIFLDINGMKSLNDLNNSHSVGTQAIINVSNRLKEATKKNDLIFRFRAGDEFMVLMSIDDNNPRTLESVFERIKKQVNENLSVDVDGRDVPFSVAMGYETLMQGEEKSVEDIIKGADFKMYQNKELSKTS
jgi:diguanylate cyclase (GGDEF)-like protein